MKQFRLLLMTYVLRVAMRLCPKDCISTLQWFADMPFES